MNQTNFSKLNADLKKLISMGEELEKAMFIKIQTPESIVELQKTLGKAKFSELRSNLPDFTELYEVWYSQSLALITQVLPSRLTDFISYYEIPKGRKNIQVDNYVIKDFLLGLTTFSADMSAAFPKFKQQLAIVKAAASRFETSIFDIRQLVQADLFDSEIESAKSLLKAKFYRASGALAGVILEKHLEQVCENHHLKLNKKNPTISDYNEFLKEKSVTEMHQWRHISMLGDLRNICSHNKKIEPTSEQVNDLIDGVGKIIKTLA